MIELFKINKGIDKLDFRKMFQLNTNSTRGNGCKLVKKFSRTKLRQTFFTSRVIEAWNGLPPKVINSSSLINFKNELDLYFKERGQVFGEIV